jgi:hypothetical protein
MDPAWRRSGPTWKQFLASDTSNKCSEYVDHFNGHRPHRSLDQRPPDRTVVRLLRPAVAQVRRRDRLGGLIHEYRQVA